MENPSHFLMELNRTRELRTESACRTSFYKSSLRPEQVSRQ